MTVTRVNRVYRMDIGQTNHSGCSSTDNNDILPAILDMPISRHCSIQPETVRSAGLTVISGEVGGVQEIADIRDQYNGDLR